MMTKHKTVKALVVCLADLLTAGCHHATDIPKPNFQAAINDYYRVHPDCLWGGRIKLPVQLATSDVAKTRGYDALTDVGLLLRSTAEKKKLILFSKEVSNYDLSLVGRSFWTPDPEEPGYGTFCYGHRAVDSIDGVISGVNASGAQTAEVDYHYSLADVPAWARSEEVKTAYANVGADLAQSRSTHDSLVLTGETWQVQ